MPKHEIFIKPISPRVNRLKKQSECASREDPSKASDLCYKAPLPKSLAIYRVKEYEKVREEKFATREESRRNSRADIEVS